MQNTYRFRYRVRRYFSRHSLGLQCSLLLTRTYQTVLSEALPYYKDSDITSYYYRFLAARGM